MINTLMVLQAVVSILLIIVVLLQFGKGAEAGLMSSGGADSVFTGAQQGNILSKMTIILSIIFMGNSILLAKLQSSKTGTSLLDTEAPISRPLNMDAATEAAEKKAAEEADKTKATTPAKAEGKENTPVTPATKAETPKSEAAPAAKKEAPKAAPAQ